MSFGENQSSASKQSHGFGAVQSMDGRRQKSKSKKRMHPSSVATSNFNNSLKIPTKKQSGHSSRGKTALANAAKGSTMSQAKLEADQIMSQLKMESTAVDGSAEAAKYSKNKMDGGR